MLQPLRNFLANASVTTVAIALMLSLPALAEPTDSDPTPMPESSLQLETEVIVFPALSAPQATPLVEMPPIVEGGGVIQYLFAEPILSELPKAQLDPDPEAQAEP